MRFPAVRFLGLPLLLVVLSGCIPPGLTVASYAVDGVSYAGTGKSLTDHMLSDMAGRDCATWRVIKSRPICKDFTPGELARRKKNRDEIRHDVAAAYIATNLDGIDLERGTLAASPKPAARPELPKASAVPPMKPAPPAGQAPKRLLPRAAPPAVEREDLPPTARSGRMLVRASSHGDRKAASRGASASAVAGGRYLVFGSFRRRADALRFAARHAVMQPAVLAARVRGQRYFRVVVRPDGRQALAAARSTLRRNGVRDAYTIRVCRPGRASGHCMRPTADTYLMRGRTGRPSHRGG